MVSVVYGVLSLKEEEGEELDALEAARSLGRLAVLRRSFLERVLVMVWWLGWDDILVESMEVRGGLVL